MPLPKPNKGESEAAFIDRCMGDDVMKKEYPDEKQRSAVCYSQWDSKTAAVPINPEKLRGREYLAGQEISSINDEKRTVDIVFFTGIDVPRVDWWNGDRYILRFDPEGADFSLLNNGAPVLDNHRLLDGSVSQKGKVEKAWQEGNQSKATLRFSKRRSVDELWTDIKDRIITKFSMGVQILEEEKIAAQRNELEVRIAKKWQPFELSIAPIPADFNTTTLAADMRDHNQMGTSPEGEVMPDNVPGTGAQTTQTDTSATLTAEQIYEDRLKSEREKGVIAELARVTAILEVNRICNLPSDFANKHIKANTPIDKFRELAINAQAERSTQFSNSAPGQVSLISDERDTRRELMGAAMLGMMNPKEKKEDKDNPFLHLSIKQIAEESVRLERNLRGPVPIARVAELAMQTTADFANVLESTARKQLLAMYAYANPTYRLWCKKSTTPDFKTMTRTRLSETPTFLQVPEGAQITIGLMSDSKESYSLATYGRGVSFTRQMLINDDLGAFNDLIGQFGIQAARLENKTVYAILTANANMADSVALFDAGHSNTGTGVIGNTALDAMFTAMKTQKGLDGVTILNLVPRFLIVPAAKEATARAALMAIGPNVKASDQNWFAGRLEPVADGELDATSTVVWYGAADPAFAPGVEYCHLEGAEGPQFIRKENEQGVLGIQFYAFLDFAAKAVDWRPLYHSTGA
ncbi:MAG: hypothetical protein JW730_18170 [Anaerolineales bacterium]|nr:hypothetical protein [Anaerolineales bacterium]